MTEASVNLTAPRRFFRRWGPPALIALTFLALTIWSWRKWPDILVDFGTELYIPWQLAAGRVLYRDLAHLHGPLSPYLNALWFRMLGVSLTTLIVANLLILAFITGMIYFIIKEACDRFTATLSTFVFLCVFGFAHLLRNGNYNYICPYAHELTHGVLFALLVIILLSHSRNRLRYGSIFLAGLFSGLAFLGKVEVFASIIAVAAVGLFLICLASKPPARKILLAVLVFAAALLIPPALFLVYLSTKMPAFQALRGVGGGWTVLLTTNLANTTFHREVMGLDEPWQNLLAVIWLFIGVTLLIGAMAVTSHVSQESRGLKTKLGLFVVLLGGSLIFRKLWPPLLLESLPLPLMTLTIGALIMALWIKEKTDPAARAKLTFLAMWAAFAFMMLGKIILCPGLGHYGFVLAMPATILLVAALLWLLPGILRKRYGPGHWFRLLVSVFLVVDVLYILRVSYVSYSKKDFLVGDRGDAILTFGPQIDPRGLAVAELLKYIDSAFPPQANFVVMRSGVIINYLERRPNPTPYLQFSPGEMEIYGEQVILESFKNRRPDYFIIVHMDETEHRVGFFGTDPNYGMKIMDWVKAHYLPVYLIGNEPLQDDRFGIKVLKRKESG